MIDVIIVIVIRMQNHKYNEVENAFQIFKCDDQWLQASLPVGDGGLGIRSAELLAPSAFLALAASLLLLQQSVLRDSIWLLGDQSVEASESLWKDPATSSNLLSIHNTSRKPEVDQLQQITDT